MQNTVISPDLIEQDNAARLDALEEDYAALSRALERRGIAIGQVKERAKDWSVAVPSWGAGRGGTRFAKFPLAGEPTNIHEKLEDCAVIHQLGRTTPGVSPHFPWDRVEDYSALREEAESYGLHFDAVNSNTFQDQQDQPQSYATGSLSSTLEPTRRQAIEHNVECIEIGRHLGSDRLTVWVGDGTNFPGQQDMGRSFDRYLDAAAEVYAALPADWTMMLEHKMFEPAFYSSVISDWGSSLMAAQELGEQCKCLVDLGHHAPNVNIEQIVARLHRAGKLGGFHFNDSKYGDDDLDSGSINPHQLFLVFNELAEAETAPRGGFDPAYMIDQSHNVTDPIESMLSSAETIAGCHARAWLVDREALHAAQESNDVMLAFRTLRQAYETDVGPILAMARMEQGGAIDWLGTYRASQHRERKAQERRAVGLGAGIV
ncbi:sugar isomerase [Erythrobacter arachoides]|uniref:Sugar isomerase n=1 Tax=Aurantiacibacter arachoides TaxID=1850444 RepID=A0A845A0D7_9SPHN|nr:TIM barrel protein [Aurantiacibacter arachoides]MXO92606.1 sugar isomerase [Aurantiacibacter arachoides]GGD55843.1 L-rhamnose catabolism isomerase [Aurantiacibacter arachoides]